MPTLYHEIQVLTSADRVWSLLTTRQGLNRWWPGEVTINGGDSWRFNRSEAENDWVFRVVEETPEQVLEWLCVQGDDTLANTLVHWRIEKLEHGLSLALEHRDLREPEAQLATLNTQWGCWMQALHTELLRDFEPHDDDDLNAWT